MNASASAMSVSDYDRASELKAFDDTKEGVKGLLDAGVAKIPKIFIRPADELADARNRHRSDIKVPVVDMGGIERCDRRREIVEQVRAASEEWGFFQAMNHGIPTEVLEEMMEGIRRFNEADGEVKKEYYSRDLEKKVKFSSNYDLFRSKAANWRDTLTISVTSDLDPHELPSSCRYGLPHPPLPIFTDHLRNYHFMRQGKKQIHENFEDTKIDNISIHVSL